MRIKGFSVMAGLALLAGCSRVKHNVDIEACFPTRREAAQWAKAPAPAPANPATATRSVYGEGLPLDDHPPEPLAAQAAPEVVEVAEAVDQPSLPPVLLPAQPPAEAETASRAPAGPVPARQQEPTIVLVGVTADADQQSRATPVRASKTQGIAQPSAGLSEPVTFAAPAPSPAPAYGHAADYSWLTGELQHLSSRNVWRLRYAAADEVDRYGGAVQLVGDGISADRENGEIVRVEGQLLNPDAPRPTFWVRSCRTLKPARVTGD